MTIVRLPSVVHDDDEGDGEDERDEFETASGSDGKYSLTKFYAFSSDPGTKGQGHTTLRGLNVPQVELNAWATIAASRRYPELNTVQSIARNFLWHGTVQVSRALKDDEFAASAQRIQLEFSLQDELARQERRKRILTDAENLLRNAVGDFERFRASQTVSDLAAEMEDPEVRAHLVEIVRRFK